MNRERPPWFAYPLLLAAVVVFTAPLAYMVGSSLKTREEIVAQPEVLLPQQWHPENYLDAIRAMPFWRYLSNSIWLCLGSVVGSVFSCSLAAYGFARVRWRGRGFLFGVLIATMLLPWQVTMVPRFLLLRELGLYNSLAALIVPTFLGEAFFIFLLRQFFLTIPEEISEAARLDGLSEWGVYAKIILPLSRPALATVALFQFIAAWNDFGGPLLYLSDPNQFPLAYGLEQFRSSYADQTHLLLAASVLFTMPPVLLFFLAQRTFIQGIATSGLKG
jgi:multiple sugar transport system permease protein